MFTNPYNLRDSQSLEQQYLEYEEENFSLEEKDYYHMKITQDSLLNLQMFGQGIF